MGILNPTEISREQEIKEILNPNQNIPKETKEIKTESNPMEIIRIIEEKGILTMIKILNLTILTHIIKLLIIKIWILKPKTPIVQSNNKFCIKILELLMIDFKIKNYSLI